MWTNVFVIKYKHDRKLTQLIVNTTAAVALDTITKARSPSYSKYKGNT